MCDQAFQILTSLLYLNQISQLLGVTYRYFWLT